MSGIDNNMPNLDQESPMKLKIEQTYLEATQVSNLLRNIIMCRYPGVKEIEYTKFNVTFGYLFDITHYKNDVNKAILKRCDHWFHTPRSSATTKNVMKGLKLYDEYVSELFRLKLLKYE